MKIHATLALLTLSASALTHPAKASDCGQYFDRWTNPLNRVLVGHEADLRHVASTGVKRLEQSVCYSSPCEAIAQLIVVHFDRDGRLIRHVTTSDPGGRYAQSSGSIYEYEGNNRYPKRERVLFANRPFDADSPDLESFVIRVNELNISSDGLGSHLMWSVRGNTQSWADPQTGQFEVYENGRLKSSRYISPGAYGIERDELGDLDCKYERRGGDLLVSGATRKTKGPVTAMWEKRFNEKGDPLETRNTFIGERVIEFSREYLAPDAKGNWTRRIERGAGGLYGPSAEETIRRITYWDGK